MIDKQKRYILHELQRRVRERLERSSWSKGVALRTRIVEGARPAQLRAGAKLLAQRALADQRRYAA